MPKSRTMAPVNQITIRFPSNHLDKDGLQLLRAIAHRKEKHGDYATRKEAKAFLQAVLDSSIQDLIDELENCETCGSETRSDRS